MAKRVVILGGGFGGLYAAKTLGGKDVEVTLIDRRNFHLFQPLLYQVATGELSPADVAFPLRAVLNGYRNIRVVMGEAADIDLSGRRVILKDGGWEPFDSLIVATGAKNHYFGNDAWAKYAPGLKSIEEATAMRHRILYAFEAAERTKDPVEHRAWLTFVVVGAGPTGVELAGALGEIANDTLKGDFKNVKTEQARILLLDGSPRVLTPFEPDMSEAAEKSLIALGVRTRSNVKVIGVDDSGVTIETQHGKEHIHAHTVLWAAGVTGSEFGGKLAEKTGVKLQRGARMPVDENCAIPGYPDIYVIGDLSYQVDADNKPLPGVAPVAMQQGSYVAKRILGKETKPFHYWDKGTLAVIGRASAVAQFGKVHLAGAIAWLAWLFIHLMYLVGFQNRLIVFIRWAFNYFTYNRGARLITGEPAPMKVHEPSPHEPVTR
jgi:NADH dehydrogenase